MTRSNSRPSRLVAGMILLTGLISVAVPGASREPGPDAGKDKSDTVRAAERVVAGIEVEVFRGDEWAKVQRVEKPLLLYSDDTRENDRGSVWGWADKGRPAVLIELYQNTTDRTKWVAVLCNTSGGRVRASRGGAPWWRANDSATELKDVPDAPAVPADPAQRQRELKGLARKFTGHEFWDPDNTRYDLRRLDRPLHTYRDEAAGILDGGVFTLANGTNPEILLFVEARADPKDPAKASWRFATGRLAHAELHLNYAGNEVFSGPRADRLSGPDKPYWLDVIQSVDAPDPGN